MKPFSKSTIVTVLGVLAAGWLAGRGCRPEAPAHGPDRPAEAASAEAQPAFWTCSMHPSVRLPEPGQCPICFMDLIPAAAGDDAEGLDPRTLRMTASALALAEIETAPVERRSVAHEVSMVGKVAMDETRMASITSWVAGRLERLYVDYTGVSVRADDHLVEIYSPTLYSAQQELLQAIETARRLEKSSLEILRSTSDQTVVSSREKLRLYGLGEEQIHELVEHGVPQRLVTIRAPIGGVVVHKNALEGMYVDEGTRIYTIADLSKVWVLLDAYETDIAWLRYGQDVEFSAGAYPGEVFHGRVAFIDPLLDDRTRTVKVRLNVDNSDGRLKPAMFVSATAHAVLTQHGKVVDEDLAGKWMCPMHPEVVADAAEACVECGMDLVPAAELGFVAEAGPGESLVIPATAPLITGKRAVVYVRVPDTERPTFEGREITLGPRAGGWYVVREGLREGEQVVVKGAFKLDSELQIRAKPSMMSPEGGGPAPGHDHGGSAGAGASHEGHPLAAPLGPPPFRRQLGAVVDAYLALHDELASDRDGIDEARELVGRVGVVDMALLEGAAHVDWMRMAPALERAARTLAATETLEERRSALGPLTDRLVPVLRTFGYSREGGDVGLYHCPMALGDGADWLQVEEQTANPYFGAEMHRCGARHETLAQGE